MSILSYTWPPESALIEFPSLPVPGDIQTAWTRASIKPKAFRQVSNVCSRRGADLSVSAHWCLFRSTPLHAEDRHSYRCQQDSQSLQAVCDVLFEARSAPLLHALRRARSRDVGFSHCALSLGEDAPLKSQSCFTSNATDSTGEPCWLSKSVCLLPVAEHS